MDCWYLLKAIVTSALVLALPNFSQSFILETGALDTGIGEIIS